MPLLGTHFWKIKEKVRKIKRTIGRFRPPSIFQRVTYSWNLKGIVSYSSRESLYIDGIIENLRKMQISLIGIFLNRDKIQLFVKGVIRCKEKLSISVRGAFINIINSELILNGKKTFNKLFEMLFEDE